MTHSSHTLTSWHLVLLTLIGWCVSRGAAMCKFPPKLIRDYPWVADYDDGGRFVAYIKEHHMTVNQIMGGEGSNYQRQCLQKTPDDKYLVSHEEGLSKKRYLCIQFIQRSPNIVQIKLSRYSEHQSLELCDEANMNLDHWPIVQMTQTPDERIVCPFVGGYNVNMYYPNNTMLCKDDTMLFLRIESECEEGEGITFDFRNERCIPAGLPRQTRQRAYCIATWTDSNQSFVILQHATEDQKILCLRTSDLLGELRTAYLMMNLVCDPETPIRQTNNYFMINFHKQVYSTSCGDEIMGCADMKRFCSYDFRKHCSRTCGDCEYESELGLCAFPEHFRGRWMESSHDRDRNITVKDYSLSIDDIANFQCLNTNSQLFPERRVLLELFQNGCYPRFACVEMTKYAPSTMVFRLGHRVDWPLQHHADQKEHICHDRQFRIRDKLPSDRLKPAKLLIKEEKVQPMGCGLPPKWHFGVSFKEDNQACSGCLYYSPQYPADRFTVLPVNCSLSGEEQHGRHNSHGSPPIEYQCLANFDFPNHSQAVVTKTNSPRNFGQYLCWVFRSDNTLLAIKAADCGLLQNETDVSLLAAQFTITATAQGSPERPSLCSQLVVTPPPTTVRPPMLPSSTTPQPLTYIPLPKSEGTFHEEAVINSDVLPPESQPAISNSSSRVRGVIHGLAWTFAIMVILALDIATR